MPAGSAAAAENIAAILALCETTPAKGHVKFTPRLARGLSYYTGAIMEIAVEGIGSLGGGGRYDGLIGMFCGEQIPACGFSLGLERILVVMGERDMFPPDVQAAGPDVLVTIFDEPLTASRCGSRPSCAPPAFAPRSTRSRCGAARTRQGVQVRRYPPCPLRRRHGPGRSDARRS